MRTCFIETLAKPQVTGSLPFPNLWKGLSNPPITLLNSTSPPGCGFKTSHKNHQPNNLSSHCWLGLLQARLA